MSGIPNRRNAVMLLSLLLWCTKILLVTGSSLDNVYEWKFFDYKWLNDEQKKEMIDGGHYDHTKLVIIDVDKAKDGRTFVTIIKNKQVPASLNTVSKETGPGGPLLEPYPDWSWSRKDDCSGILNVYRVAIDHCDRMWVLDTGKIEDEQICPAQLLVFNLTDDSLIERVKIPDHISQSPKTGMGLLVTPVVETYGSRCSKTYVYMADVVGHGMVIYDGTKLWRLESNVYEPDPAAMNFTIEGEHFYYEDGVLGMALSPRSPRRVHHGRMLFFKSLASFDMNSVSARDLQMSRYAKPVRYYKYKNVLPSQSAAQAFSSDGILFFGLTKQTSIACWNQQSVLDRRHMGVVAKDKERLQFASGVKIVPKRITGCDEELWIVTNRLQKIMSGTMKFDEINFRIMKGSVDKLVSGSVCRPNSSFSRNKFSSRPYYYPFIQRK